MASADNIEMKPRKIKRGKEAPTDTDYQPVNWKRLFLAPKYLVLWIILLITIVLTIIITIKHDEVVAHLRPWAEKVRDLPAGWLIPIAILIIISFPPLFGHEIIALLCGVIYGLWIGFGIVAAGTFLGELGTWFAFQWFFRKKAEKLERTNLNYGALARITRDGGFWIVLLIRFSAIPSHFSTAVFSTCGVNFWSFTIATALTLPKQIFLVYLGVLLLQSQPDGSAKNIVFGVAFAVTIVMAVYIGWKMRKIKVILLEEQAERRKTHLQSAMEEGEGPADERDWIREDGQHYPQPQYTPTFNGQQGPHAGPYGGAGGDESDIGVASSHGRHTPPGMDGMQPPAYRQDFGYHGAGGRPADGAEPVREHNFV
ncbi:snare associated Golgi protein-domain-containing protein [Dichotomopilus funicola]|uniref:Golgi apparatus membrane protein TVP38 n=1 Tax=Dichotomopilus funicola TaxID=1934379 RepID=A0AAN6UXD7_9PEZI|nr:snare associated Golgi protein-domain-containing protein [Dichotomopilus funicola]